MYAGNYALVHINAYAFAMLALDGKMNIQHCMKSLSADDNKVLKLKPVIRGQSDISSNVFK